MVGFEIHELVVEETVSTDVILKVARIQGQLDREFVIGVRAVDDTATSKDNIFF